MQLRADPQFMNLLEDVKSQIPVVPEHDYKSDNTEAWKALSNQRQGFELCLSLFGELL